MAYDLVKQTHPGAPCAIGARVTERGTGRLGSIVHPRPGQRGVAVKFDGVFGVVPCAPGDLDYAGSPPQPTAPWCVR